MRVWRKEQNYKSRQGPDNRMHTIFRSVIRILTGPSEFHFLSMPFTDIPCQISGPRNTGCPPFSLSLQCGPTGFPLPSPVCPKTELTKHWILVLVSVQRGHLLQLCAKMLCGIAKASVVSLTLTVSHNNFHSMRFLKFNFPSTSLSSVQFSYSVVSNSLQPHGLQHTRLPCLWPIPGACSNSCPSSWWCHPTISSSVVPLSSCLQSFPASQSFPMSQFFSSGGPGLISFRKWFDLLSVH